MYRRLEEFEERFGREALDRLLWWERCIFIHDGADRASEFLWRMVAYSQPSSNGTSPIGSAFESVRHECLIHDRRAEEEMRDPKFSAWDRAAIEAEGSSRVEVADSIKTIAAGNAFARSWHSNVTAKGTAFLDQVFSMVSNIPASSELRFDPETIPFPSSWEFDLRF